MGCAGEKRHGLLRSLAAIAIRGTRAIVRAGGHMLRWEILLGWCLVFSVAAHPGALDRTFRPSLPADARVEFVFEQADGSLLVSGTTSDVSMTPALTGYDPPYPFFVRLRIKGRVDRSFDPQREPFNFVG